MNASSIHGAAIALAFFVLILAGCGDQLPTGPDGETIMPLTIGNMWIGQRTSIENGIARVVRDTIAIVDERRRDGRRWYDVRGYPVECFDGAQWMRNGPLGLEVDTFGCTCGGMLAKYPARVGDTFAMMPLGPVLMPDHPEPVEYTVGRRVLAVDSVITVPAGTFSCYVYRQALLAPANATFVSPPPVEFYAPDVGIVRIELYANTGEIASTWELVKARLR